MSKKEMYNSVAKCDVEKVRKILSNAPQLINEIVLGQTWLNLAAKYNSLELMELFVEKGISVNVEKENVEPPLSTATENGSLEAVEWLLLNGANVDGSERFSPPLVGAILSGSVEIVKLLIKYGAKTDFTWGHLGYSPITFAQSFGPSHSDILNVLKKDGGQQKAESQKDIGAIEKHLEKFYGPLEPLSLHEIISDMPIKIHVIKHEGEERCLILATSGMSARAMSVPKGAQAFRYSELLMYLPYDWPLSSESMNNPDYNWPVEWLRRIAHYPHLQGTWMGGHSGTFSNEEPPEPFAKNTQLSCMLALSNPGESGQLIKPNGDIIQFYSLYPIYKEERELVMEYGEGKLLEKFQKYEVSAIIDVNRMNVALK